MSSQTLLPSEPPDSLMTEECGIVLIQKLHVHVASNLAAYNSLKELHCNWFILKNSILTNQQNRSSLNGLDM